MSCAAGPRIRVTSAPVIETARVASAGSSIARALGLAVAIAEEELEAGD